jgi:hypothetical protein
MEPRIFSVAPEMQSIGGNSAAFQRRRRIGGTNDFVDGSIILPEETPPLVFRPSGKSNRAP